MLRRLLAGCALLAGLLLTLVARDVRASVSLAATWEALLHESTAAVVVTPIEARAVWEDGRIYTYTHVNVDRAIAGELASGASPWVRTMGGVVGKIGQIVDGEPVLVPGRSSLVFLHPGPVGAFEVTARGQGQFPVVVDDPRLPARVVRSNSAGAILPRPGNAGAPRLAAEVIHGRPVDDVAREIAADWARTRLPAGP
jgi:hypothetical protein